MLHFEVEKNQRNIITSYTSLKSIEMCCLEKSTTKNYRRVNYLIRHYCKQPSLKFKEGKKIDMSTIEKELKKQFENGIVC